MKIKTTLWLLIVAALMAAIIWYLDHVPLERTSPSGGPLLTRLGGRVDSLSFIWPETTLACRKTHGLWTLTHPVVARVDDVEMDRILAVLRDLIREEVVSDAERVNRQLSLADYGLDEPRVRIVLGGPLGKEELWVGHDAPLDQRVYVKVAGEKSVIATGRAILGVLTDRSEQLRDRHVFHGQPGDTVRLGIKQRQQGFMQVARSQTGWVIQQPLPYPTRADEGKVAALLGRLFALRVKQFVWDPPIEAETATVAGVTDLAGQSNVESYRLAADEAVATVTLWFGGEEVGRELLIGKLVETDERAEVYARIEGMGSVFTLDRSVLDLLAVNPSELRDRRVFALDANEVMSLTLERGDQRVVLARDAESEWSVREPVQWRADGELVTAIVRGFVSLEITSFVVDLAPEALKDIGLAPPAYTVTLNPPSDLGGRDEVRVDSAVVLNDRLRPPSLDVGYLSDERKTCYVAFRNSQPDARPNVFEVSSAAIRAIVSQDSACDPLQYRDRTMLSLATESVRRISLVRKDVAETVRRVGVGEWETEGATNRAVSDVVSDLLFFASNLRASRVEALNPKTLVPYGLDVPEVTLTFGLTGESGIHKTILFGHKARTDGIYSMVQGQDVVFVLDRTLVDLATRHLVKPAGERQEEIRQ